MRPEFIKHISELEAETFQYPNDDEWFAARKPLSRPLGFERIGVHADTLEPGRRSSYPHAESTEEECVFVLEGFPHVWLDGELAALRPGDFCAFVPGSGIVHTFQNNTSQPVKLLVIGERRVDNKVAYPLNAERLNALPEKIQWHLQKSFGTANPHAKVRTVDRSIAAIRPVKEGDGDILYDHIVGTNVPDTILWDGPKNREEMVNGVNRSGRETADGDRHFFVIEHDDEPVGCIDVRPQNEHRGDVGLWVSEHVQGRGVGTAAVAHITDYAFKTVGLHRVEATIFVGNHASRRAFEKNGYRYEGTLRGYVVKRGEILDEWLMAITRQ